MNKFIIFALLFVFVLNDTDDYFYTGKDRFKCYLVEEPNVNNCTAITLEDDEFTCCFHKYKEDGEDYEGCQPIKKNKVGKVIDEAEDEGESDVSIDCSSNYISNALLFLLSLLF